MNVAMFQQNFIYKNRQQTRFGLLALLSPDTDKGPAEMTTFSTEEADLPLP